jgi:hypothetical protein
MHEKHNQISLLTILGGNRPDCPPGYATETMPFRCLNIAIIIRFDHDVSPLTLSKATFKVEWKFNSTWECDDTFRLVHFLV